VPSCASTERHHENTVSPRVPPHQSDRGSAQQTRNIRGTTCKRAEPRPHESILLLDNNHRQHGLRLEMHLARDSMTN
jgi:hypothetical protein